jgi:hypothetical protein
MKFQTLNLDSDIDRQLLTDENDGFWRRQFRQEPTRKQKVFDWAYGVAIPLVCVAADPIVFRQHGLLGNYKPFAYLLSAVSILAMAAWLLWGKRLRWLIAPVAGLFIAGSGVSMIVGIILFPFSLVGVLILIGFLGFTPLVSSFVYLRNGVRALVTSETFLGSRVVWQWALLGAMFALVIPYVANSLVSSMVNEIVTGDVYTVRRESARLKYVSGLVDFGPLAARYFQSTEEEKGSPRMKALAEAYQELSGKKIENAWDW